jgi:hypothetical protein
MDMSLTEIADVKVDTKKQFENLKDQAKIRFGFSETDVKTILKAAGYKEFKPEGWHDYLAILEREFKTREIARGAGKLECPICGSETRFVPKLDGMYHQPRGWECLKDSNHFTQFAWERLKPFFVGTLEPEEKSV